MYFLSSFQWLACCPNCSNAAQQAGVGLSLAGAADTAAWIWGAGAPVRAAFDATKEKRLPHVDCRVAPVVVQSPLTPMPPKAAKAIARAATRAVVCMASKTAWRTPQFRQGYCMQNMLASSNLLIWQGALASPSGR